jgi:hypothetical protein
MQRSGEADERVAGAARFMARNAVKEVRGVVLVRRIDSFDGPNPAEPICAGCFC